MERNGVSCRERRNDSPARGEQPDERHDRERHSQHAEAEVRRRDAATRSVLALIEEAEARRQGKKGNGDHRAPRPPALSYPADPQKHLSYTLVHRGCHALPSADCLVSR